MRGDLVTIVTQGDFGKPRPALVIQADYFDCHASVTVLPVTSTLIEAPLLRAPVQPDAEYALRKPSQIMVDKAITVRRDKLGRLGRLGRLDAATMLEVDRRLALFVGIAV